MCAKGLLRLQCCPAVKRIGGFAAVARTLAADVKRLARLYETLVAAAPRRHDRGERYLHDRRNGLISGSGPSNRTEEHLAVALCNASRDGAVFALPDGRSLTIIDYQTPLKARQGDRRVGKVDLLAVVDGSVPCVIELKVGGGSRDTPLRALLQGLAYCAIVEANAPDIASEIAGQHAFAASRPTLVVMAPDDYWVRYLNHRQAGSWLPAIRDLVSGLRDTLGLETCLVALLDARFEMGLCGRKPRLVGSSLIESVDERLVGVGDPDAFSARSGARPGSVVAGVRSRPT